MTLPVRLCLVLHNHQPVGNFDGVFEQAYQDSYLPFLEVFEPYSDLQISLHTSGPLVEWLDQNHPEYLDRLAALVSAGRVEIIGGAYFEPILPMLPSRDRVGQITRFTDYLQQRLGGEVKGMWMPERVWEQSLVSDLARADIRYTVLDDCHFRNAGLTNEQLNGYFLTEDQGRLLKVFPGSEHLRYLLPFRPVQETIDHLRELGERVPGAVAVFGDDGEKFGTWPDTKKHVYEDGWLVQFFDALSENRDWLKTTTLAETAQNTRACGKVYVPDASYREMTEWALPTEAQVNYDHLVHDMHDTPEWQRIKPFLRGGYWRNFKVKYPETNEMYARMMYVSSVIEQLQQEGQSGSDFNKAIEHLYRGQCNCPYWHGAFGGVYLPHLRNAIFQELIKAENCLDRVSQKSTTSVEAVADDFNFDGLNEVRLANSELFCWVSPSRGGMMYELDVRSIAHNLLATLDRRPEAYHEKVRAGQKAGTDSAASIHDRVVFKQEGLDQLLQYDSYRRKSLVDHFWDNEISLEQIVKGDALERGDFATGVYETQIRRGEDRVQVHMTRAGNAWGIPITIIKAVTMTSGSDVLEVAYMLEGLPQDRDLHFAVEWNFAGLPAGADDRYFHQLDGTRLGQLGQQLDLHGIEGLGLTDQWLGIDVRLQADRPTSVWTHPIATVSQSEGGFEGVHQSVVVMPHWIVTGDANGRWSVRFQLACDTSQARSRMKDAALHS